MTSLTLNKITSQRGISVGEATKKISDLGWNPTYVQEANTFPTDYKIAKAPRDPMKQVLRSYFPMQEEKDNRVYGALDAALRGDMFRNVEPRWVEWMKLFLAIIPFPEISAARSMAMVARLAPGHVAEFSPLVFVLAVLATLVWCWLVRWRTGRHRAALWKTLVLPAGGVTLCWMLLMTLWLPALDHALSYAPQVRAIAQRTGPTRCVAELGVGRAQIAALRHHAGFDLQPINSHTECDWLIVKPEVVSLLHHIVSLDDWRLIGTFRRTTNPNDDLLLYQRAPAAAQ